MKCICTFLLVLLAAIGSPANAQSNQWAFIKGDTTANQYGVYGFMGVNAYANKPGARADYVCWTDLAGNFWLFGGKGYAAHTTGYLNDLWKYNISNSQWTWVKGDSIANPMGTFGTKGASSSVSVPRGRGGAMGWIDPSQNLWLFGGEVNFTSNDFSFMNDLWKYSITTNEWTWVRGDSTGGNRGRYNRQGISSVINTPGGRKNSVCWSQANEFWLFGGSAFTAKGIGAASDLWKYNSKTNEWTWVKGDTLNLKDAVYGTQGISSATNKPGARTRATGWKDKAGNFWLFGGEAVRSFFSDLWKYNPSTNEWTWMTGSHAPNMPGIYGTEQVPARENTPPAKSSCTGWTDTLGNLWLFGGITPTSVKLSDLWKYAPQTNEWTFMKGDSIPGVVGRYGKRGMPLPENKPGAKVLATAGWVDLSGNLWLFGGTSISAFINNDLWKYSPK